MNIFAIGDIHGAADRLERLLAALPLRDEDRLVFLGDYLNRGTDSRRVLDLLLEVRERHVATTFLLGNHEHALLQYAAMADADGLRLLREMGLQATLDSYGHDPAAGLRGLEFLPQAHRCFLQSLEPCLWLDNYFFFHAPIPADVDPLAADAQTLEQLLARRSVADLGWEHTDATLVFGHVPFETPLLAPGLIGIDTGAAYGQLLTAVQLPARRFHHM